MSKPLFIPLKREYFEAFERGEKRFEYRLSGARWNERTCVPGREALLSLGYGKHRRLRARVVSFTTTATPHTLPGIDCYGEAPATAAIIELALVEIQG